jgi:arsenate reductase
MVKVAKVLFLCRGNASRAQIAAGFLRELAGDQFIPFSAGTEGSDVSPTAIEVMSELGIDIAAQKPSEVASLFRENFQYVVALGDESRERYPIFPFARNIFRWAESDPEFAASALGQKKQVFCQVRDHIKGRVTEFVEGLNGRQGAFTATHANVA